MSLSILSYERYAALLRPTKADVSDFRRAWICVAGTWLYSLVWTLPPFLGWSSYGPEGPGTTCSVQWHQRSTNSMSYVMCLFIFCLLLPLMLMIFCYGKILFIIKGVSEKRTLTIICYICYYLLNPLYIFKPIIRVLGEKQKIVDATITPKMKGSLLLAFMVP